MNILKKTKRVLNDCIDSIITNREDYVTNPFTDFTRCRTLDLKTMIQINITQEKTTNKETLRNYFGRPITVSNSAYVQQRAKIKSVLFEDLFSNFTNRLKTDDTFKGYKLLAADGCDLPIFKDESQLGYYHSNSDYNSIHINAIVDALNGIVQDVILEPGAKYNETQALIDMINRNDFDKKTIITADRLYEYYNLFETIAKKGLSYVIRIKDIDSNGILSALTLPSSDEFDMHIHKIFTRKQTNEVKNNKELYKFFPDKQRFDFFDENGLYEFNARIVRVKLDNEKYQCLITNLDTDKFSSDDIKAIYKLRWGIEIGFRELKYVEGLNKLHSKKIEFIYQEIYAKLILHNFTKYIVSKIEIDNNHTNYRYRINYTQALYMMKYYLISKVKDLDKEFIEALKKELLPIRPGRQFKRKSKSIPTSGFNYR